MTVDHTPLSRTAERHVPLDLNAAADAPQDQLVDLDRLDGGRCRLHGIVRCTVCMAPSRPAWTYARTDTGFAVKDPDGGTVAYAVGERAARVISEGMTVYVQLDDEAAPEAEVRADRDTLAHENGALREERDLLREQLNAVRACSTERGRQRDAAEAEASRLRPRTERQARTISDLLQQTVGKDADLDDAHRELQVARDTCSRYARDRDDLRNQVIRLQGGRDDSARRFRQAHGADLGDIASALGLPADASALAVVDRAAHLAALDRSRLQAIAERMSAEARR